MSGRLPSSRPLTDGLRRVFLLALDANAERFLHLAREFRALHRLWMGGATWGFRRLSPSAELMVDPESGARCVIRGAGGGRYCA
jgi:hypothetical protein